MMISLLLLTFICSLLAIFSSRILIAVLALAAVSALTSISLYLVGAVTIAVIELSIGTGLATILMVFVITMIGEGDELIEFDNITALFTLIVLVAIIVLTVPMLPLSEKSVSADIHTMIWQVRGLDWLPQIGLMFVGTLGALALSKATSHVNSLSNTNNDNDDDLNLNDSFRAVREVV